MNIDKVLDTVTKILPPEQFSSIESFVLRQSWLGQTYKDMAQNSGYNSDYIKEIGFRLWRNLSDALGQKVTKKNLHLVLSQYQQSPLAEDSLPAETEPEIKFPSGPLASDSPLYINRPPVEELAYAEIRQPGCMLRVKAPRNMGKSSLLNQIIAYAKKQRYKTVYLDFQEADEAIFTSLNKFLRWFCTNITKQLGLIPKLDNYWDGEMGTKVSCKVYFEEYLLKKLQTPLVLALNEVNRIFDHPDIAIDFFSMLQFWHEIAKQIEIWQKFRLIVVQSADIYIPIKLNQSPFNIGRVITLPQFTLLQVQDLAQRYGMDWKNELGTRRARSLLALVGGHPYLVNVALYHLRRGEMKLAELLQTYPALTGIYSHHLQEHLTLLREEPKLVSALHKVVTAPESVHIEAIAAYKLESMGLVQFSGSRARPSCELYRLYFQEHLGN